MTLPGKRYSTEISCRNPNCWSCIKGSVRRQERTQARARDKRAVQEGMNDVRDLTNRAPLNDEMGQE